MPFELDPDEVELVAEAPPDELVELCVDGLEDWVEALELEFEPHAASPRAANASKTAARRRVDLVIVAFIIAPLVSGPGRFRAKTMTPVPRRSFPHAIASCPGKKLARKASFGTEVHLGMNAREQP